MRIAILILLAFFLYRYFRKKKTERQWPEEQFGGGEYDQGSFEEMVEDPYCKTFIQKGRAIKASVGGKTYFFCSSECRDRFLEKLKK